ncbi:MAG: ABC transporter ATP-binding protein [Ruminococcus bromii]
MVEIKNYCNSIKSRPILNNVSYNFEYGKIYGIYGHNGSGKTMLLRAIAGLLVPDSGSVVIDGKVLHKDMSFPPSIGIVIENMNLLPQYNAFDNLKILGKIKKTATDEDIKTALERVGLKSDLKVKKFSLGMKQRLNIAQAVFEKQKIILLDEPTNALDNDGVQLIYKLLKEEKERGALVVITTHHNEDLKEICDVVLEMTEGELHEK